ncbi:MAG: quinone-dependent dihydroorotate dehydrogenase [Chitinophagales bacterium]|nr:quinone-dependent dihydroorotate dehydrogenase [Chitinophagales bacterium]MDW8420073.1 quinone-dependent dihydroorotate dehydrogenase [Chitinophagales bacterium]
MNWYALIRPLLFRADAETAHHLTLQLLKTTGKLPFLLRLLAARHSAHPALGKTLMGLHFKNPVGLAAGLDKNAEVVDEMAALGFGFVEIGTVTPRPQPGNDKPRLFRLTRDEALINRMGFNNIGADAAAARLKHRKTDIIVGANIGKNKTTPNAEAVRDYTYCFKTLYDYADYFVVNVSSPNTPGLRELQDKDALRLILHALQEINHSKPSPKPILLKISPDLTPEQVREVTGVVNQCGIQGIVATNTTIERHGLSCSDEELRAIGEGGLSGKPLTSRSTQVIAQARRELPDGSVIVGVGGIMAAADAMEKLSAGADLIQLYTGFVYHGPHLIQQIAEKLLEYKE